MAESSCKPECWICRSTETALFKASFAGRALSSEDMRVTDARYGMTLPLYRCGACGFIFADLGNGRSLLELYEQLEDPDYDAAADVRRLQMEKLLDRTLPLCKRARTLLDIGAGTGLLVDAANRRGLQAEGIEPSAWAVELGRRRFSVALHAGTFPHERTRSREFDVITLVDVIEHVDDPVGMLRSVREHLAPNGIVVIVTPDVQSAAARLLRHRWWHYRLAHVGYFSKRSMQRALSASGLRAIQRRRASWYFTSEYLLERVAVYCCPLALLRGLLRRMRLERCTIPLNLFDSWCYVATPGH